MEPKEACGIRRSNGDSALAVGDDDGIGYGVPGDGWFQGGGGFENEPAVERGGPDQVGCGS